MGLNLDSPLVAAASPLSRTLEGCRRLEDAGISAIVLFSLFEETVEDYERGCSDKAYRTQYGTPTFGPHEYVEHLACVVDAVDVPVLGSLNVSRVGPWESYAVELEQAGAAGIELDIYKVMADPSIDDAGVLAGYCDCLHQVKRAVSIPVALKLAPYFTNLAAAAARFDEAGADALVLFNRFFQPSIDVEERRLLWDLDLSTQADSRLPMMWIAILTGQLSAGLAASGGIFAAEDVVRMLMAGADVAMLCSVLLAEGPYQTRHIRDALSRWLDEHHCETLETIRGVMRLANHADAEAYKRGGYARILNRRW